VTTALHISHAHAHRQGLDAETFPRLQLEGRTFSLDILFYRTIRGDKLSPYDIIVRIGAGGVDEVSKARDTRLNRFVAIKTPRPAEDALA
jgi:hypothetical protein